MSNANLGSLLYYIRMKNQRFKQGMQENKREIKGLNQEVNKSKSFLKKYSDGFKKVGTVLTAFGAIVTGTSYKLAKMASDANEIQSRFDHVFGEMSDDANEWAENFADSFGQSNSEIKDMMATLQDTLVPMGVAEEKAYDLTQQITQLALDMSSFANVPLKQAMSDIQSALVGQSEPMRKYGSVLTENRVKQNALKEGIIETDRELSEQEKIVSLVNLMFKDMEKATGDYERTQDSFANQLRETRNLLKNIGEDLGKDVLPTINGILQKGRSMLEWFNQLPDSTQKVISQFMVWSGIVAGIVGPLSMLIGFLPQIEAGLGMISGAFAPMLIGGGIIAGIYGIVKAFDALNETQQENIDKMEKEIEKTEELVSQYEDLNDKENKTAEDKEKLRKITSDLADIYPDAVEGIDKETGALIINTEVVNDNKEAKRQLMRLENVKKNIEDTREEIKQLQEENKVLERSLNNADLETTMKAAQREASRKIREFFYYTGSQIDLPEGIISLEDMINIKETEEFQEAWNSWSDDLKSAWRIVEKEMRDVSMATGKYTNDLDENKKKIKERKKELKELLELAKMYEKYMDSKISYTELEKFIENRNKRDKEIDSEPSEPISFNPKSTMTSYAGPNMSYTDYEELQQKAYDNAMKKYRHDLAISDKSLTEQINMLEKLKKQYAKTKDQIWAIDEELYKLRKQRREKILENAKDYPEYKKKNMEYLTKAERKLLKKSAEETEKANDKTAEIYKETYNKMYESAMEYYNYQTNMDQLTTEEQIRRLRAIQNVFAKTIEQRRQLDVMIHNLEIEQAEEHMQKIAEESKDKYENEEERVKWLIEKLKTLKKNYADNKAAIALITEEIKRLNGELGNLDEESKSQQEAFEKWLTDIGLKAETAKDIYTTLHDGLVDGLTEAITKGKDFLDVLKNIADQIAAIIVKRGIVEPLVDWMFSGFELAGTAHGGGLVTVNGIESIASYHTGGISGTNPLRPDEKIVKTKVGELILNEDQQRGAINAQQNKGNTQNIEVYQINAVDAPSFQQLLSQNKAQIVNITGQDIMSNGQLRKIIQKFGGS